MNTVAKFFLVGLLVGASTTAPASAAQLLVNPGLTANGADWTFDYSNNSPKLVIKTDGTAWFGAEGGAVDTLSQVLPTIAGNKYDISFNFSVTGYNSNSAFTAKFGDTVLYSFDPKTGAPANSNMSFTETASPTTASLDAQGKMIGGTVLSFAGMDNPGWEVIGNISVNGTSAFAPQLAAVPLPGALPMFGAALVGLGGLARRRAKQAA
ncbi:MAG TPA: hypothetical protein HPQ04_15945 [Rhodospirillaceae bacterium]|nr:hypothetical protein [Rhodospirillaceae bacterium]